MYVWEIFYVNDFWLLFPFRFVAYFSIVVVTGIVVVHVVVVSFILSLKMGNGWILDVLRLGFFIFCSVYFFFVSCLSSLGLFEKPHVNSSTLQLKQPTTTIRNSRNHLAKLVEEATNQPTSQANEIKLKQIKIITIKIKITIAIE